MGTINVDRLLMDIKAFLCAKQQSSLGAEIFPLFC